MLLIQLSLSHSTNIVGYAILGTGNLSVFPTWCGGVTFPGCVLYSDMVTAKYVVDVKPDYSGVVIQ